MLPASSIPYSPFPIPESRDIVLAFSGGLDTSFCIPWLQERGYEVHTVFADTGGVDDAERAFIEARAVELGAAMHNQLIDTGCLQSQRAINRAAGVVDAKAHFCRKRDVDRNN